MTYLARALSVGLIFSAILLLNSPAQAGIEVFESGGNAILSIDVPDGWVADRSNNVDNKPVMVVYSRDRSAVILLTVYSEKGAGDTPRTVVAKQALKVAGAEPYDREEPFSIDGRAGSAFVSRTSTPGGPAAIRLKIVRLDASRVAMIEEMSLLKDTPAQLQALSDVASKIHISDHH